MLLLVPPPLHLKVFLLFARVHAIDGVPLVCGSCVVAGVPVVSRSGIVAGFLLYPAPVWLALSI